ncbi:hypothetical protein WG908_04485 [Sphingobium sp. AN641]|uniref:hypothetical protein n=1 Tax=Sphingobium sp. AN641 TaxID=3133443 RepID=UPI0030C641A8
MLDLRDLATHGRDPFGSAPGFLLPKIGEHFSRHFKQHRTRREALEISRKCLVQHVARDHLAAKLAPFLLAKIIGIFPVFAFAPARGERLAAPRT